MFTANTRRKREKRPACFRTDRPSSCRSKLEDDVEGLFLKLGATRTLSSDLHTVNRVHVKYNKYKRIYDFKENVKKKKTNTEEGICG